MASHVALYPKHVYEVMILLTSVRWEGDRYPRASVLIMCKYVSYVLTAIMLKSKSLCVFEVGLRFQRGCWSFLPVSTFTREKCANDRISTPI